MEKYQYVEIEQLQGGVLLWLNNPTKRNAISRAVIEELMQFFSKPSGAAHFVIVAGRGECFAAGADLKEMIDVSEEQAIEISRNLHHLLLLIGKYSVPVVAAVHGYAVGGGLELALGADMIFAAESAWFSLPEMGFSLIPGGGATQRLPQIVGRRNAFFQILSSTRISGKEAVTMGIVQKTFADEQFFLNVVNFVSTMMKDLQPDAVLALKRAIRAAGSKGGYTIEAEGFAWLLTHKGKSLIKKFLEKN